MPTQVIVTIGIDSYAQWPQLANATSDARAVSALFVELGFTVGAALYDAAATGAALRRLVTDELARFASDTTIVVYFAGHGAMRSRRFPDGTEARAGYIFPVDADNQPDEAATLVRLDAWLDDIAQLPAQHILVIIDACHSGIAIEGLVERDVDAFPAAPADDLIRRRSRRLIVSALDDQRALDGGPVPGHSLFTGFLLQALSGGLARDGQTTTTGSELGLYLQQRVRGYPNSRQTPDFGAFKLDNRGEPRIPLRQTPLAIPAPSPLPVAPASLLALASKLGALHPDRPAIEHFVAAHQLGVTLGAMPDGAPTAMWMHVLGDIASRGELGRLGSISRAVSVPVGMRAAWSYFDLALRGVTSDGPVSADTLTSDHGALLEATGTLLWGGPPPPDPAIMVASSGIFGRRMPLPHELTVLSSTAPRQRSWRVQIRVPRWSLRTQRITIACPAGGATRHSHVVTPAGAAFAVLAWIAFAAFAVVWLWPVNGARLGAPLGALGIASGLWSWFGRQLVRASGRGASLSRIFAIWEYSLVAIAAVATLIVAVPPRALVLVDNTTDQAIQLEDGAVIPASAANTLQLASSLDGALPPPFCVCGRCGDHICPRTRPGTTRGVPRIAFACLEGDCATITEHIPQGGTIVRPVGVAVSPLAFAAGTTTQRMELIAGPSHVRLDHIRQTDPLAIVPDAPDFTIDFVGAGRLTCHVGARRVIIVPIAADDVRELASSIGGTASTWVATPGATGEARACTGDAISTDLMLAFGGEHLVCSGASVVRVVRVAIEPARDQLVISHGALRSTWSAPPAQRTAHACLGTGNELAIAHLAAGQRITLPDAAAPWRTRVAASEAIPCPPGVPVRAVALEVVSLREMYVIGPARVARIDDASGLTCSAPVSDQVDHESCTLSEDTLACRYQGACDLATSSAVTKASGTCDKPATLASATAARARARSQRLICTKVFQCD